ncbi:MAG: ECF-type sigma factor [Phycisphaerales bacterium JB040]
MPTPDVTILLRALGEGRPDAPERLFEAVYDELRAMAEAKMRRERRDHTLQPTALVNEAFLRLVGNSEQLGQRAHFFGAAARAMERVLVDHAREKAALKRGGGGVRVSFDEVRDAGEPSDGAGVLDVLGVHEAIEHLEREDPALAMVVRYRYFVGMRLEDIAEITGVSLSTVRRQWAFARAWLFERLSANAPDAEADPGRP